MWFKPGEPGKVNWTSDEKSEVMKRRLSQLSKFSCQIIIKQYKIKQELSKFYLCIT